MKLSAFEDLAQLSRARQDADAAKLQTIRAEEAVQVELENRALRDRKLKAVDAVTHLGVYQRQRRV